MFWLPAIFSYAPASDITGQSAWIHFSSYLSSDKGVHAGEKKKLFSSFFQWYKSHLPPAVSISSVAGRWEAFPYFSRGFFFFFLSLTLKHIPVNFLINSLSLLYADAWCDVPSLCSAARSGAGLRLSVGIWLVAVSGVHGAFVRKLAGHWRTPLTCLLKSRLIQHCLNNGLSASECIYFSRFFS